MDRIVFLPSAGLGICFIVFYLYRCHNAKKAINISILISLVLQASGIVCGLFLIASTIFDKVKAFLQGIDIYIFIAGLAVIAVSLQGFHRDVIKSTKSRESDI